MNLNIILPLIFLHRLLHQCRTVSNTTWSLSTFSKAKRSFTNWRSWENPITMRSDGRRTELGLSRSPRRKPSPSTITERAFSSWRSGPRTRDFTSLSKNSLRLQTDWVEVNLKEFLLLFQAFRGKRRVQPLLCEHQCLQIRNGQGAPVRKSHKLQLENWNRMSGNSQSHMQGL